MPYNIEQIGNNISPMTFILPRKYSEGHSEGPDFELASKFNFPHFGFRILHFGFMHLMTPADLCTGSQSKTKWKLKKTTFNYKANSLAKE
jgi:hypothetical protein